MTKKAGSRERGSRRVPVPLTLLTLTLVILAVSMAIAIRSLTPRTPGTQIGVDRVTELAADGKIRTATFLDHDARVVATLSSGAVRWAALSSSGSQAAAVLGALGDGGATVIVDQQWGTRTVALLAQFILPLLVLANLFGIFILLARGGASQVKELFAFGRIGGAQTRGDGGVRFDDVASLDETIVELAEVRDYLENPARFEAMGALPPKGVLLYGPPGCGKTLLAKALAGEAGVPFFSMSGSEFVESLVGVGAARVRDLFRQAIAAAPAIIFIDELDAAGRKRGAGIGGGHDEREQTLNEMLVQMDGFAPSLGVVIIGATNRPDILDPALLRPGRFDRHITVEAPDVAGREEILRVHARGRPMDPDVDLGALARSCPGFTGADLASVCNEAALLAVRRGASTIAQTDLGEAILRVQFGPKRRGRLLERNELHRLAVHEAGHVVVADAVVMPGHIHRVSITSRGRDVTQCDLMRSDRAVLARSELMAELTAIMGGIAAERLAAGEISTASESDLDRATNLAREIAGRYGMSDQVGRLRVVGRDDEVFLGRDYLAAQHAGAQTLERLDEAVAELIGEAEDRAMTLLRKRRRMLDEIADALLEHETLDEEHLGRLLATPLPAATRRRSG